jgi:cytochrome c oxidase subunit IV
MNRPLVSARFYLFIWAILTPLVLGDWIQIQFNLGPFNIVLALTIAVVQVLLSVLFFMHVWHSPRLTWVFVVAGFIWLLIMINLTLSDYLSRTSPIHNVGGLMENG